MKYETVHLAGVVTGKWINQRAMVGEMLNNANLWERVSTPQFIEIGVHSVSWFAGHEDWSKHPPCSILHSTCSLVLIPDRPAHHSLSMGPVSPQQRLATGHHTILILLLRNTQELVFNVGALACSQLSFLLIQHRPAKNGGLSQGDVRRCSTGTVG
jgi:hypothetical protein